MQSKFTQRQKLHPPYNFTSHLKEFLFEVKLGHMTSKLLLPWLFPPGETKTRPHILREAYVGSGFRKDIRDNNAPSNQGGSRLLAGVPAIQPGPIRTPQALPYHNSERLLPSTSLTGSRSRGNIPAWNETNCFAPAVHSLT